MKICVVTSSFPRYIGDSRGPWILEYSKQLVNLGARVHVLCPKTHACGEKDNEIMQGVYVHRFSFWPFRKWQNLASPPGILPNLRIFKHAKLQVVPFLILGWLSLLRLIKRYNIDIIFSQWVIPSGFWGITLKKVTKLPVIISAQGAEFFVKNFLLKFVVRETMRRSEVVLPVSFHMKRLGMSFGIPEKKFHVVPNAVNIETFKRVYPHSKDNKFKILTVRRLVPEKRVQDVITAFAAFNKKASNVKLTIIGDGPERQKLEDLTKELNCSSLVTFLGFIPNKDLPRYYNNSSVYVLSSVQEGLSLSLLEAMACGLPVISTNIVGNPEVIGHKVNGFLVAPKTPKDISAGMFFFYNNRDRLDDFGKKARRTVERGFTSEIIGKEIFDICKQFQGVLDKNNKEN